MRLTLRVARRGRQPYVRLPDELMEAWGQPGHLAYSFRGGGLRAEPLPGGAPALVHPGEGPWVRAHLPAGLAGLLGGAPRLCLHPVGGGSYLLHPPPLCPTGREASLRPAPGRGGGFLLSIPLGVYEEMGRPRYLLLTPAGGGVLVAPLPRAEKVVKVAEGCCAPIPRFLMEAWCWPRRLRARVEGGALIIEGPPRAPRGSVVCALCGVRLRDPEEGAAHVAARHGFDLAAPPACAARALLRAGVLRPVGRRVGRAQLTDAIWRILSRHRGGAARVPLQRLLEELGCDPVDAGCRRSVMRLLEEGGFRVGGWAFAGFERSGRRWRLVFVREGRDRQG